MIACFVQLQEEGAGCLTQMRIPLLAHSCRRYRCRSIPSRPHPLPPRRPVGSERYSPVSGIAMAAASKKELHSLWQLLTFSYQISKPRLTILARLNLSNYLAPCLGLEGINNVTKRSLAGAFHLAWDCNWPKTRPSAQPSSAIRLRTTFSRRAVLVAACLSECKRVVRSAQALSQKDANQMPASF